MKICFIKKLLPLLLSVILILSALPISLSAAGTCTVSVSEETGNAGENVICNISVKNNPGIAYLKLRIEYDGKFLSLTDAENTGALSGSFTESNSLSSPYVLLWISPQSSTSDGIAANLEFSVSEECPAGKYPVSVTVSECYDQNGNTVAVKTADGSVSVGNVMIPTVSVSSSAAESGDTVTLDITLKNNPGMAYLKLKIGYDENILTPVGAENTGIIGGSFVTSRDISSNPYSVSWTSPSNMNGSGVIARLTFAVSANAENAKIPVTVNYIECYNEELASIYANAENGNITVGDAPVFKVAAIGAKGSPGDTVRMILSVAENPGIAYFKLKAEYDTSALTLISCEDLRSLPGTFTTSPTLDTVPYVMMWLNNENTVLTGDFVVLTFKINAGTPGGNYPVKLCADECYDDSLCNVATEITSADITVKPSTKPGDINGDNKVNTNDALILVNLIVGKLDREKYPLADLNGDGKLNIIDCLLFKNIIVGKA